MSAVHNAEAVRAATHSHWLRSANRTQADSLLSAMGGSDEQAARAAQVLGYDRLGSLAFGGKLAATVQALGAAGNLDTLLAATSNPAQQRAAISALQGAATSYASAAQAQAQAPGNITATVGEPSRFPPEINAVGAPKPNLVELATVQKEIVYKTVGGSADRALDRHVFQPWNQYVAQPTAAGAMDMYSRFAATPVGQYFETQAARLGGAVNAVVGEGTPVANLITAFDQGIVKNERLWAGVDKVGAAGRKVASGAAATTLAIIANAHRTGTLQTGTFNTSGTLTPEQLQMVKGINIPPNINVRYFTVPTTIPVTVKGETFNVKGAATIVVGDGSNVVFLPALGPGRPGAQPWFGPVQDGGALRNQKQLVAASSSVAAARWDVVGFSLGTTNFNVGGRADLQVGRGLLNIFAAQLNRDGAPPGKPRATVQSILIGDAVSTFHTASFNAGPLAIVVDRVRNPQNERVTLPNGSKTVTLGTDAHPSSVQPAFPLLGASTWNPEADDIRMFKAFFGQPNPKASP